jgi:transposase-like protein
VKKNINNVPHEKKDIAQKFKAYKPGYLHIDVTYLPKFKGQSYYLFVAIDRAIRTMFYQVYENKISKQTSDGQVYDRVPVLLQFVQEAWFFEKN